MLCYHNACWHFYWEACIFSLCRLTQKQRLPHQAGSLVRQMARKAFFLQTMWRRSQKKRPELGNKITLVCHLQRAPLRQLSHWQLLSACSLLPVAHLVVQLLPARVPLLQVQLFLQLRWECKGLSVLQAQYLCAGTQHSVCFVPYEQYISQHNTSLVIKLSMHHSELGMLMLEFMKAAQCLQPVLQRKKKRKKKGKSQKVFGC